MSDAIDKAVKELSEKLSVKLDRAFMEELLGLFKQGVLWWDVRNGGTTKNDGTDYRYTFNAHYRLRYLGDDKIQILKETLQKIIDNGNDTTDMNDATECLHKVFPDEY